MTTEPQSDFKWRRPAWIAPAIVLALIPGPLIFLIAQATHIDALALLAAPCCVLIVWPLLRLRGECWANLGFRRPASIRRTLGVAIAATVLLVVGTIGLRWLLTVTMGWQPDTHRFDALRGNWTLLLFGLVVAWTTAAFAEELLFRGFIMHSVHQIMSEATRAPGPWIWALVISAVLFGLGHAYQGLAGAIITFAIALGYGAAFFANRRNLWSAILAHGLYDTVAFLLVFLNWDQILHASA
jgi:membrane protease YdiL (CAAX protease family)